MFLHNMDVFHPECASSLWQKYYLLILANIYVKCRRLLGILEAFGLYNINTALIPQSPGPAVFFFPPQHFPN